MPDNDDPNKGNDPTAAFQSRLAKMNGDAMAFATTLFDENWQHRQKIRELEGKVPADGTVTLSKADAARWEAFQGLNLKPEEVKQKLADAETHANENADLKKKDILRDVAAAQGYKLSVLQDRDKASGGLEYILKDEKDKDGKARKVAYVKHEDKEVPLEQFAESNWTDFVPALKAEQAVTGVKRGSGGDPRPAGNQNTFDHIRKTVEESEKSRTGRGTLAGLFNKPTASQ